VWYKGAYQSVGAAEVSLNASCNNFLPLALEDVYNGYTENEQVIDTRPKGSHINV